MEDLGKGNNMTWMYVITDQQILVSCEWSMLFSLRENGTTQWHRTISCSINQVICDQSWASPCTLQQALETVFQWPVFLLLQCLMIVKTLERERRGMRHVAEPVLSNDISPFSLRKGAGGWISIFHFRGWNSFCKVQPVWVLSGIYLLTESVPVTPVEWPVEMLSYGTSGVRVMSKPQISPCNCMRCGHIILFAVSVSGSFDPVSCFLFSHSTNDWVEKLD